MGRTRRKFLAEEPDIAQISRRVATFANVYERIPLPGFLRATCKLSLSLSLSLLLFLSLGSSSDGDFRVSLIREIHVGITSASDLRETEERLKYASQAGLARAAK